MVCEVQNGNFDIDNMPCSERPSEFDKDHLKVLFVAKQVVNWPKK